MAADLDRQRFDGLARAREAPDARALLGESLDHATPDAAARSRHEGGAPREGGGLAHQRGRCALVVSLRNSSRVRWSSRKTPRMADVIVLEFCFSTPRII